MYNANWLTEYSDWNLKSPFLKIKSLTYRIGILRTPQTHWWLISCLRNKKKDTFFKICNIEFVAIVITDNSFFVICLNFYHHYIREQSSSLEDRPAGCCCEKPWWIFSFLFSPLLKQNVVQLNPDFCYAFTALFSALKNVWEIWVSASFEVQLHYSILSQRAELMTQEK